MKNPTKKTDLKTTREERKDIIFKKAAIRLSYIKMNVKRYSIVCRDGTFNTLIIE